MGNTVKMYTLRRRGHCIFSIFFGYIKERPWYLLYNNVYDPYIAIRDEDLRYIAAASPDVVLALIAELRKCEAMCEIITEQGARIERCLKMVQKMAGLNGLKMN